jgi:hypothetical protein
MGSTPISCATGFACISGSGERGAGAGTAAVALPAFIPVVAARPTAKAAAGLVARLPNGVRLELSPVAADDLAAILHQLWALPCSGSTPD